MRLVTMKFSASQTTAMVVDQLCAGLRLPRKDLNLNEGVSLGPQDCLIAAFPVFSGRLPAFFQATALRSPEATVPVILHDHQYCSC